MPVPRKVYHHRVHVGGSFERWAQERDKLQISNEKFAQVLLDNFLNMPVKSVKLEVFTQTNQEKLSKSTQTAPNSSLKVSNQGSFDVSTSTEETYMKNIVANTYSKYSKANPKPSPSSEIKYGLAIESPMGSTPSPSKRKTLFSTPKGKRCRVNLDELWQSPMHQSTIVEEDEVPTLRLRKDRSKESDIFEKLLNPGDLEEDEECENEAEPLNFANTLNEDEESHGEATNDVMDESFDELIILPPEKVPEERNIPSAEEILSQCLTIVNLNLLSKLVEKAYGAKCSNFNCRESLDYSKRQQGSAVVFSWVCRKNNGPHHSKGQWATQPTFQGIHSGNLVLASCIPLSGNIFGKIAKFMTFSKIMFFGKDTYYRYQKHFIAPAVDEFWVQTQRENFSLLVAKSIVLAGDGRNDSPGHTAMYCTYSLADHETQKILAFCNRDVRHAGGKSPNMEIIALKRAAAEIVCAGEIFGFSVAELVTDAHILTEAAMKKNGEPKGIFPYAVKHSFDVWHGGKNILKDLMERSLIKGNKDLAHWAPQIRNHFWYCARECEGDEMDLKELWSSCLWHVTNVHEWLIPKAGKTICDHEPLTEEKIANHPWLTEGSKPFKTLSYVVMNNRRMDRMSYYVNFRHTGFIENYHSLILKYASKRFALSFDAYEMRIKLAAIDHNHHVGRAVALNKTGEQSFTQAFNKRSKKWFARPILEEKSYSYLSDLLKGIFEQRAKFEGSLKKKIILSQDHPHHIHKNRCMITPPTKEELINAQQSRFVSESTE